MVGLISVIGLISVVSVISVISVIRGIDVLGAMRLVFVMGLAFVPCLVCTGGWARRIGSIRQLAAFGVGSVLGSLGVLHGFGGRRFGGVRRELRRGGGCRLTRGGGALVDEGLQHVDPARHRAVELHADAQTRLDPPHVHDLACEANRAVGFGVVHHDVAP